MTTKLRTIRTTPRSASVKRSDVSLAARAVVASRNAGTGRFVTNRNDSKKSATASRKS